MYIHRAAFVAFGLFAIVGLCLALPAGAQSLRPAVSVHAGMAALVDRALDKEAYLEVEVEVEIPGRPLTAALYVGTITPTHASGWVCSFDCPTHTRTREAIIGLRLGLIPRTNPVRIFVGLARQQARQSVYFERTPTRINWEGMTTAEGGVRLRIPLWTHLALHATATGYLPLRTDPDARPVGAYVTLLGGVQYRW